MDILVFLSVVHMLGLWMAVCTMYVVFYGFPQFPPPYLEKGLKNGGVHHSYMP